MDDVAGEICVDLPSGRGLRARPRRAARRPADDTILETCYVITEAPPPRSPPRIRMLVLFWSSTLRC